MVLVEPMLWTRFGVRDGEVTISVHINGPPVGDPVLITTEATLREIVGHRLTSKRADETGLIRIYGDSAQAARLRAIFADGAVRILE